MLDRPARSGVLLGTAATVAGVGSVRLSSEEVATLYNVVGLRLFNTLLETATTLDGVGLSSRLLEEVETWNGIDRLKLFRTVVALDCIDGLKLSTTLLGATEDDLCIAGVSLTLVTLMDAPLYGVTVSSLSIVGLLVIEEVAVGRGVGITAEAERNKNAITVSDQ